LNIIFPAYRVDIRVWDAPVVVQAGSLRPIGNRPESVGQVAYLRTDCLSVHPGERPDALGLKRSISQPVFSRVSTFGFVSVSLEKHIDTNVDAARVDACAT
jgi:hypothetical protein